MRLRTRTRTVSRPTGAVGPQTQPTRPRKTQLDATLRPRRRADDSDVGAATLHRAAGRRGHTRTPSRGRTRARAAPSGARPARAVRAARRAEPTTPSRMSAPQPYLARGASAAARISERVASPTNGRGARTRARRAPAAAARKGRLGVVTVSLRQPPGSAVVDMQRQENECTMYKDMGLAAAQGSAGLEVSLDLTLSISISLYLSLSLSLSPPPPPFSLSHVGVLASATLVWAQHQALQK